MSKSPDAFRTISEVSDVLDTPAHVLRFWESKFNQIKPVKRAGGRRYYRPQDISLLAGIKHLLHEQGMTIKGAQKLLREKGVKHVAALTDAPHAVDTPSPAPAPAPQATAPTPKAPPPQGAPEADNVIGFAAMPPPTPPPMPDAAPVVAAQSPKTVTPDPTPVQSDLFAPPSSDTGARVFGAIKAADPDLLRARVADIAPLVDRLHQIRARMGMQ